MPKALRNSLPQQARPDVGHHAGLILTRYLSETTGKDPSESPGKSGKDAKQNILTAAKQAAADPGLKALYKLALERWRAGLPMSGSKLLRFETESRIIVGLGGDNVTETGLTLHHTYGVPYLPGSALKGLTARYARQMLGGTGRSWHPEKDGGHFRTLFGTTGEGGLIDFHDGWITHTALKNCLLEDVITPHHQRYYMEKESVPEPTDFDNPVPVPFLAVRGAFLVGISKRDARLPDEWLETAKQLLVSALREWGIGGKTNAGYGCLVFDKELALRPGSSKKQSKKTKKKQPAVPARDVPVEQLRFFLGGQDLEMTTIRELLDEHAPEQYTDDGLAWGAKASHYKDDILAALAKRQTVVLVELLDDLNLRNGPHSDHVFDVEHHGELAGRDRPTALEQVFQLLRRPASDWTRHHELVAANDRGHVRAMLACQASQDELEWIRFADREAQGITSEEVEAGRLAAERAETLMNGWLTVVTLPHSRTATVTDVLQTELGGQGYKNLLVLCPDSVMFYGEGSAIDALRAEFPDGFYGGELPDRGFWGRAVTTEREDMAKVLATVAHSEK